MLAKLISQGTGQALEEYAKEKLFTPLGIEQFDWVTSGDGSASAASGLRLTTRGLGVIGQMISAGGAWNGQQIVPKSWLEESFTPRATTYDRLRYGYHFYLDPRSNPPRWVAGFGNGGQRVVVNPGLDAVIVIFAGNYNKPDAWEMPVKLTVETLIPAILPKD